MRETPLQPTGLPELDTVLDGGLLRGTLAVVLGVPGSGKTTLAGHLAFAAAGAGRKALILTALSEPTNKLIAHLSAFTFFDSSLLVERVQVLSLQQALPNGLKATGDEIIAMVRQFHADLIVIDGFRGMRENEADLDQAAGRQFLYRLGTTLSALGVTTIVTSEADPRDPAFFPEMTTADVIIGLHYSLQGVRHVRALEVIKARGAAPLHGLHAFVIDETGACITPRLETVVLRNAARQAPVKGMTAPTQRTPSDAAPVDLGTPGLDAALGGAVAPGTSLLIAGMAAQEQSLLALRFALASIQAGERVVYRSLGATQTDLLRLLAPYSMGEPLEAAWQAGGPLRLMDMPVFEDNPDLIATNLLDELERHDAQRLVVDGIEIIEELLVRAGDALRGRPYFTALRLALQARHVTSCFVLNVATLTSSLLERDALQVADTLLLVRRVPGSEWPGGEVQLSVGMQRRRASQPHWYPLSVTVPDGPRLLSGEGADPESPQRHQSVSS